MREVLATTPSDWETKELGRIALFLRRGKSPDYAETNEGTLVISQDCVRWKGVDLSKAKFHKMPMNHPKEFYLRENDILINSTGTGTIGRVTQWAHNGVQAVADSHVTVLRINPDFADDKFIRYFLTSESAQRFLEAVCFSGSTNQIELSRRYFSKMVIPCPILPEQRAIASILTKVEEAIEATRRSIQAAERLKRALMQNLLTGKLKPDGTPRTDDEFYTDPKFGKVPIGWEVAKLRRMVDDCQYGLNTVSDDNGGLPMFRMNNIIEGKMVAHPMVSVKLLGDEIAKYRVEKGDILFNRTNSPDLVGKVGIFKLEGDFVYASYLIRLRVNEENSPDFVNYFLNSYKGQTSLRATATASVSQANINAKSLLNTYLPKPPKKEQEQIVVKIQHAERLKQSKQTKITTLERLKKSLMQNLLTGKVRVAVDQLTEPVPL